MDRLQAMPAEPGEVLEDPRTHQTRIAREGDWLVRNPETEHVWLCSGMSFDRFYERTKPHDDDDD